ncbi:molecular chaperone Tir [Herbaspirillum sp. HC18]|nr:molecular chaperone Tir [Herbaspirillum sp. HC18]
MSKASAIELASRFCELSGLSEPEQLLQGKAIEIDGVAFSLGHSDGTDGDLLFIYADFGAPPAGKEARVFQALLEANTFLHTGPRAAFAISPETNRVMFIHNMPLATATPEALSDVLADVAVKANEWRAHYFLDKSAGKSTISTAQRMMRR